MAWAFLFLSLHTAAEIFLVGIERLPLLEQIKPRNWQVVIAEVGNGLGDGGLLLPVCGVLLTTRRLIIIRLLYGIGMGIFGCRLYRWNNNMWNNIGCIGRCICWIVEPLVDSICRKLLAQPGTIQYRHGIVVNECNTINAPFIGIAENHIYVTLFQLGDEV